MKCFAETAGALQAFMSRARSDGIVRPGVGMAVDVDPIALL